jgi:hypothetical protein
MENLKKQHSLVIFISYVILVNVRPNHLVVDSIVLALLFGYVLFEKFLKYKTLPDIRKEVETLIKTHSDAHDSTLKLQSARIQELETQIRDTNSSVNKVIQMKSVNLASSVKF